VTPVVDAVVFGIWIVFWIYWLAASASAKATRRRGPLAGFRIGFVLLALLLLRAALPKGDLRVVHNHTVQAIGLAVLLTGLGLAVWARVYLGRNWGTPMSQRVEPELVTTGPYRSIRHPIYSAMILALIGTTIAVSLYWLAAVVISGAYFVYSAFVEERNMTSEFPEAYPAYQKRTKMLVPFVF